MPDAYDAATAARMIDIGLTAANETTRAKVWTSFDGAVSRNLPQLIDPLCRAVAGDPSAQVRAEAAETLGNFPKSPAALAALEDARQHDPDGHVRRKAERTLKEMRSGQ